MIKKDLSILRLLFMDESEHRAKSAGLRQRYQRLSTSKKVILIVFIIWFVQALPKWTVALTADGELSSKIMRVFITPLEDIK